MAVALRLLVCPVTILELPGPWKPVKLDSVQNTAVPLPCPSLSELQAHIAASMQQAGNKRFLEDYKVSSRIALYVSPSGNNSAMLMHIFGSAAVVAIKLSFRLFCSRHAVPSGVPPWPEKQLSDGYPGM